MISFHSHSDWAQLQSKAIIPYIEIPINLGLLLDQIHITASAHFITYNIYTDTNSKVTKIKIGIGKPMTLYIQGIYHLNCYGTIS